MKIYLKLETGRRFFFIAPIWLVKAGLGFGTVLIRHLPEQQRPYVENIDFRALRKSFDVLKNYKGLELVNVRAKDGTEVKIVI